MLALDFGAVLSEWPLLLRGLAATLVLTGVASLLGVLLGIVGAWSRSWGPPAAAWVVAVYVELIRNTPFIVQLFFLFFGLPALGVRLSPELAAVLAMVLNLGAYATEIVRAGVEATPRGQIEAGLSLAMSRTQVFVRVVLPPALKRVWPAMIGQIIIVMLGSSICGQIAAQELSYSANLIQSRNFRAFEVFIVASLVYLCVSVLLRQLLSWGGKRFIFGR